MTFSWALAGRALPIYGDGLNVRDWLYVGDHCAAIRLALGKGRPGQTYNIGGNNERTNIDVVRTICRILDKISDRQWDDAFRSAAYPKETSDRYIRKLKSKIQEGLALTATTSVTQ